jgi:hypothetical protein
MGRRRLPEIAAALIAAADEVSRRCGWPGIESNAVGY